MLFVYPAVFHKEDGSYWVEFPDLVGCQTYGETLNETMACAQEALAGYLLTMLEEGREIAAPSDMTAIAHVDDSFLTLVSCDVNQCRENREIEKTLTIPAWLNDRAVSMGIDFSQALQEALLAKIQAG